MSDTSWTQVNSIVAEVLESETSQREAILTRRCSGNEILRLRVEEILEEKIGPDPEKETQENDPWIGRQIGHYTLERLLGKGGMGAVYAARRTDDRFQGKVALKIMTRFGDDNDVQRFELERQILVQLNHPNIARLYDGGTTDDGFPYLALEYVDGVDLMTYCTLNKLDMGDRLRLFTTICRAVHFAHQNLILHRDLKPANILVTNEGVPKLLDFGIAKLLGDQKGLTQTFFQAPLTPRYASPEQIMDDPLTTNSDVFSLGILIYEMLTGIHPFSEMGEVMNAICDEEPSRPSVVSNRVKSRDNTLPTFVTPERLKKVLSGDLDNIIMVALRKEPEDRYHSAEQFADDIERYLMGYPVLARGESFSYVARKFIQRHLYAVSSAVLVFLLILSSVLILNMQRIESKELRKKAERLKANKEELRIRTEQERDIAVNVSRFLERMFQFSNPTFSTNLDFNPSAKTILDNGFALIVDDPEIHSLTRAAMLVSIGKAYFYLFDYGNAKDIFEEAYETLLKEKGPESRETNEARMYYVILSFYNDPENPEIKQLFNLALDQAQAQLPEGDPVLADILIHASMFRYYHGNANGAISFMEESIITLEPEMDTHWAALMPCLRYLCYFYITNGDLEKAWTTIEKGIRILEEQDKLETQSHTEFLNMRMILSRTLFLYDDAFTLCEKNKATLSHLDFLNGTYVYSLYECGFTYAKIGKIQEALQFYDLLPTDLPFDKDQEVFQNYMKAIRHMDKKQFEEAEKLMYLAMDYFQRGSASENFWISNYLNNLIFLYLSQNRWQDAVPLAKQSLAILQTSIKNNTPLYMLPLLVLANHATTQGDLVLARKHFEHLKQCQTNLEQRTFLRDLSPKGEWLLINQRMKVLEAELYE